MNKQLSFVVLASTIVLLACGGGGGNNNDDRHDQPDITIPESANQDTSGFIAYLTNLVKSNADLLEPVDIGGFNPPVPEKEDPVSV